MFSPGGWTGGAPRGLQLQQVAAGFMSCGHMMPAGLYWRPQTWGEPTPPPADLCHLVSRVNTDLCRFCWLEAGPLFAQPRGGEAPEGGRQGSFGGHAGVWSDCDWVPPPPGQTPFSRPGCISACFRILVPVLSLTAGLQRGPQAACPLCPQGPTRLAAPPFVAGRPPPQGKAPCAPPPPWLS